MFLDTSDVVWGDSKQMVESWASGPVPPITGAMREPWDQIVGKLTAQRLGISINTTIQGHIWPHLTKIGKYMYKYNCISFKSVKTAPQMYICCFVFPFYLFLPQELLRRVFSRTKHELDLPSSLSPSQRKLWERLCGHLAHSRNEICTVDPSPFAGQVSLFGDVGSP